MNGAPGHLQPDSGPPLPLGEVGVILEAAIGRISVTVGRRDTCNSNSEMADQIQLARSHYLLTNVVAYVYVVINIVVGLCSELLSAYEVIPLHPLEINFRLLRESRLGPFDHESSALVTKPRLHLPMCH